VVLSRRNDVRLKFAGRGGKAFGETDVGGDLVSSGERGGAGRTAKGGGRGLGGISLTDREKGRQASRIIQLLQSGGNLMWSGGWGKDIRRGGGARRGGGGGTGSKLGAARATKFEQLKLR